MPKLPYKEHLLSSRTQLKERNQRTIRQSLTYSVLATGTQHDPDGGSRRRGLGYP
jgi:hypothetical protein